MNARPESLWWDTLPPELRAPVGVPLDGDEDADVAIVGAGYTGLWTAYYLARHDPTLRIRVLDAHVAGFGASGRNGGWVSALFPVGLDTLARASSRAEAVRLKRELNATVDEIGRIAQTEHWDIGWRKGGTIVLARTEVQLEAAAAQVADLGRWGFGPEDARLLDSREAQELANGTRVLGGTFTPHCAAIHPARLVRHLAHAVAALGVRIHEHSPVDVIEPRRARCSAGTVRADIVVRATEGYTPALRRHARTVAPVHSLMLATEPLSAKTWERIGLTGRPTFSDGRHLIVYGQRTIDDRIAFGGRGARYRFGSRVTPEQDQDAAVHDGLHEALVDLFPVLHDAAITHTWGGPLAVARDWWASCGLDARSGLAWAGGYVGDGVATSNLAGRTLADLITGRRSDLTTLPWVNHRSRAWEPEPLRWIGTNLGMHVMSRADRAEDRTGRPSRSAAILARLMGQ